MSKQSVEQIKPFFSVLIIIFTLFLIVFVKMEIRRAGYVMWKDSKVEKRIKDKYYRLSVKVAQYTGPKRIHKYARAELDMQKANYGQIIHMSHQQVALKQ